MPETGGGSGALGGGSVTGGGTSNGGGSMTGGGSATGGGGSAVIGGGTSTGGGTAAAGETCALAPVLTAGTQRLLATGLSDHTAGCGDRYDGNDRAFKISVPAGQRLVVTATPAAATSGPQLDVALYLVKAPATNCTTNVACLRESDGSLTYGSAETVAWFNRGSSPQDLFIVVDSFIASPTLDATDVGTFDLSVTFDAPPGDDFCSPTGVTPLLAGTPLLSQSTAGYTIDFAANSSSLVCLPSQGLDRVYTVTLAAGQRGLVTATPTGQGRPVLNVIDGNPLACSAVPLVCVGAAEAAAVSQPAAARLFNDSTASKTYFVVVSSSGDASSSAEFDLSFTTAAPPANDVCATATAPLAMSPVAGSLAGFVNDYGAYDVTGCPAGIGSDRVYTVSIPPGQRLTAVVTPTVDAGAADAGPVTSDLDIVATLIAAPSSNCESAWPQCAASADGYYAGHLETLSYVNQGTTTAQYFLVIGSFDAVTMWPAFTITPTLAPAVAGDVCSNAIAAPPGTLSAQTTSGLKLDFKTATANGCKTYSGADRVYEVTLPAAQTLTVTVTPPATMATADGGMTPSTLNPVINVVEGPATNCTRSPTCVASCNAGTAAQPETLTYTNSTAASKTLYVVVSDASSNALTFSLTIDVR